MDRIKEIEERNKRHKQIRDFGRSQASVVSSNKEIDTLMFELKHIHDVIPDDIEYLLAENKRLNKMTIDLIYENTLLQEKLNNCNQYIESLEG